jgi:uncharacterized membrane protein (UPF0127 family)
MFRRGMRSKLPTDTIPGLVPSVRSALVALLLLAACAEATGTSTSTPPTSPTTAAAAATSLAGPTTVPATAAPETTTTIPAATTTTWSLPGFDTIEIAIDGQPMLVALAETPAQRGQGLMGVTEMPAETGMLFVFPVERITSFWMKDTLIPLDIAFFDGAGVLVEVLTMEPCQADPCPTYGPEAPFKWAVEAPAGAFSDLDPATRLELPG